MLTCSRGTELCTVVETMFSYEIMFQVHGVVAFADKAERIAYNALPATWADPANSGSMWFVLKTRGLWSFLTSKSFRNHQYLQQCNEVNAEIENDHIWATDGPDAIMYGLEPNYGENYIFISDSPTKTIFNRLLHCQFQSRLAQICQSRVHDNSRQWCCRCFLRSC